MNQFTWDSELYRENSQNQLNWGKKLIEKLNPQPGEDILDIGCGNGTLTALIAKRVASGKVLGIDSSPDMIKLARKGFSKANYPALSFEIHSIEKFGIQEDFDAVFSNAAMNWVKDQALALENIYNALRKSGRLIMQFGGKNNAYQMVRAIEHIINKSKYTPYFKGMGFPWNFLSAEEYKSFMTEAGFSQFDVFITQTKAVFNGKKELEGWIRSSWHPYLSKLPKNMIDPFVEDILEEFCLKTKQNNNSQYETEMFRLNVFARK